MCFVNSMNENKILKADIFIVGYFVVFENLKIQVLKYHEYKVL